VWGYVQKSGQGAVFFKTAIGAKLLAGAKRCLPMLEINTPVKHVLTNQKRYIFHALSSVFCFMITLKQ